jgi:hypothetical protein
MSVTKGELSIKIHAKFGEDSRIIQIDEIEAKFVQIKTKPAYCFVTQRSVEIGRVIK